MATNNQMRNWTGPIVLSYGFRPFFLLSSLWAILSMALWVGMLSGGVELPTAFGPVDWHAHAFLIGYLGAVATGFLLTAVPNWTGRLPVVGWPLGGLVGLWIIGRIAVLVSNHLPAALVAVLDLSFLIALAVMVLREIVAGKNWRNMMVLVLVLILIAGGALYHWHAAQGGSAAQSSGLRLMLAAAIMLISVIGGRIVPSFTRNWLVQQGSPARPAPPMQRFDKVVLGVTLIALMAWVVWPEILAAGMALITMGAAQATRLARWAGHHTWSEPLVWVLHLAYAFVPLGALALGFAILRPDVLDAPTGQHLWMAGAIGLMTLGVMTRATLGHTGQVLTAGMGTTAIYLALMGAVFTRVCAGILPQWAGSLYMTSGVLWCLSFLGFALIYGPLLLWRSPRQTQ